VDNKRRPSWDFFGWSSGKKVEPTLQVADQDGTVGNVEKRDMESIDTLRGEQLKHELIELESECRRVQMMLKRRRTLRSVKFLFSRIWVLQMEQLRRHLLHHCLPVRLARKKML